MAQVIEYIDYVIFFNNNTDYQFALSVTGGNPLLQMAPRSAATLFGIPYPYPSGDMDSIPKGIYFFSPLTPGAQIGFPNNSGVFVDDTVDSFVVPGQLFPSISPVAGPDGLFIWSGNLILNRGAGASAAPPATPIAQRRFCVGFEQGELQLEGSGTTTSSRTSKDSSRTIDGKGLSVRGDQYNSINMTTNILRTALTTNVSWERFYIRVRKLPSAGATTFWRTHANTAPAAGAALQLLSTGEIKMFNVNSVATFFDKGVAFTPTLNTWYKLDVFVKYDTGLGTDGRLVVYVNGVATSSFVDGASQGLNSATGHVSTDMGGVGGMDQEVEMDFDDWINADIPGNMSAGSLGFTSTNFALDWLMGSHVRKHVIDSASLVNWTPNSFGILNQGDNPIQQKTAELTSTTSAAQIIGLTDALLQSQPDSIAVILGAVAAVIGAYSSNSGATDGRLGYKIAGGAAVLATINEFTTFISNVIGYLPSGKIIPDEISPFSLVYEKSADANTATVDALTASVEYIGVWADEDDPTFVYPTSRLSWLHNSPYFNTVYGYVGSAPAFPVAAVGGTYAGNSLTNTITLPGPCQFIWLRCTDGGGSGTLIWVSGSIGIVLTSNRSVIPDFRVYFDFINKLYKFQVTGASNLLNLTGKTYQYIAFCDPGMQYNLSAAFGHDPGTTTPKANPLINSAFTPNGGFILPQYFNTVIASSQRPWYKGPGVPANEAWNIDNGTSSANVMNFAAGVLNTLIDAHFDCANCAYSLWRTTMGGGCGYVMVQMTSYVGDGAGSKNIALTPTSGRFPLFVMVQRNGGNGFYRDPSHAGNNSSFNSNNGISTTAITAVAVDQITVGSALNNLGTTYTVFAICGDSAGMNNGTYFTPICGNPTGSPYAAPSAPVGDINVMGNGGLILNGQPALTLLRDISGIYTLISGKRNDTLIDRQTGQPSVDVEIPDPTFKTGYIGG